VRLSPRALLIYFSLIFVSGLLIRLFVSPVLWPNIPEVVDPGDILLSSAIVFLSLAAIYYLKTSGSARQVRIFWMVAFALMFSFALALAGSFIIKELLGLSGDTLFVLVYAPLYLVGLPVGALIGNRVGKRMEMRDWC
jgi:hypothetical protein